jgi:hypothetical protein
MKKRSLWIATAIGAAAICLAAGAADTVEPANATITSLRDEGIGYVSTTVSYYEGSTLRFTNCVLYSGATTNTARQGLDEVTVTVDIGNTATNVEYDGVVISTNGVWGCDVTVPTDVSPCYMQLKITDTLGTSYIYPWKIVQTTDAL